MSVILIVQKIITKVVAPVEVTQIEPDIDVLMMRLFFMTRVSKYQ
jgi:hypothetical protein